jgi:hypothetical protein
MTILKGFSCLAVVLTLSSQAAFAQGRGDQKVPPATAETPKQGAGPAENATVLQDFKKRIDDYVRVHSAATKKVPPLKTSDDPAKIESAQQALASTIATMRANAKPGDIFTPEITKVFKRILAPELKGKEGADAKETIKDDAICCCSMPRRASSSTTSPTRRRKTIGGTSP